MKDAIIPLGAIIAIGGLTAIALMRGIDGALLTASFVIIGGIAGYKAKDLIAKIKR